MHFYFGGGSVDVNTTLPKKKIGGLKILEKQLIRKKVALRTYLPSMLYYHA